MDSRIKRYNRLGALLVFVLIPPFLYALGDFPSRTPLKELFSILTIGAFFIMLLQFYLSRANRAVLVGAHSMSKVMKWHKVLGYVFVSILIIHPFLIVIPRYFEAGVEPRDAFVSIISTWGTKGVFLGMIAWVLMFIIGLTSALRNRLGLKYKTWRLLHGILSILFISFASFHAIELGRHINLPMAILIISLASLAIILQLKVYRKKNHSLKLNQNE